MPPPSNLPRGEILALLAEFRLQQRGAPMLPSGGRPEQPPIQSLVILPQIGCRLPRPSVMIAARPHPGQQNQHDVESAACVRKRHLKKVEGNILHRERDAKQFEAEKNRAKKYRYRESKRKRNAATCNAIRVVTKTICPATLPSHAVCSTAAHSPPPPPSSITPHVPVCALVLSPAAHAHAVPDESDIFDGPSAPSPTNSPFVPECAMLLSPSSNVPPAGPDGSI
jgi:hypothetical protein